MKKSLLWTKLIVMGFMLANNQCSKAGKAETKESTGIDSISRTVITAVPDTTIVYMDSSGQIITAVDTTKPKRIEHGSDNAARLDSIKKAKTKKKH